MANVYLTASRSKPVRAHLKTHKITAAQVGVLKLLCDHARPDGSWSISQAEIADEMAIADSTVRAATSALQRHGLIEIRKRHDNRGYRARSTYSVRPVLALSKGEILPPKISGRDDAPTAEIHRLPTAEIRRRLPPKSGGQESIHLASKKEHPRESGVPLSPLSPKPRATAREPSPNFLNDANPTIELLADLTAIVNNHGWCGGNLYQELRRALERGASPEELRDAARRHWRPGGRTTWPSALVLWLRDDRWKAPPDNAPSAWRSRGTKPSLSAIAIAQGGL